MSKPCSGPGMRDLLQRSGEIELNTYHDAFVINAARHTYLYEYIHIYTYAFRGYF